MELIIVRHGQAKHNIGGEKSHIFAGNKVDNELTDQGKKDAEKIAELLEPEHAQFLVSSKLKRSQQTAEIIGKEINLPVKAFEELNEFDVGDFAGHTEDEVKKLYTKESQAFYAGEIDKWIFPGGENFAQVKSRLEIFIEKLKGFTRPDSRVIIVGHGGINRVLFFLFAHDQKELWQPRSYPHDRISKITIS